jgi:hypothetical protein
MLRERVREVGGWGCVYGNVLFQSFGFAVFAFIS